jgi:hypothetical protein
LGDFFTNSSGHPGGRQERIIGIKWRAEEEDRHNGSLTPQKTSGMNLKDRTIEICVATKISMYRTSKIVSYISVVMGTGISEKYETTSPKTKV